MEMFETLDSQLKEFDDIWNKIRELGKCKRDLFDAYTKELQKIVQTYPEVLRNDRWKLDGDILHTAHDDDDKTEIEEYFYAGSKHSSHIRISFDIREGVHLTYSHSSTGIYGENLASFMEQVGIVPTVIRKQKQWK